MSTRIRGGAGNSRIMTRDELLLLAVSDERDTWER